MTSILLADDHRIVRQGLRALLESEADFEVVSEAADGIEAARLVERLKPDVLVLDLEMPGLSGLEVARQSARRAPQTKVVVLSMHSEPAYVYEALRLGVSGYVVKDTGIGELFAAVRAAQAGRRYLSQPLTAEELTAYQTRTANGTVDPYERLTPREREVLQLVAGGCTNVEVGRRLSISPRTAETHRANLMRKLALKNQAELVRYAVERGLVLSN